ncbi:secondary thiamine-phosphate synthase enzyme YjbQ [Consotaella aegiceratis]|uniref:secondary thiamine-phosphate synthase enzyme YjbQ n=1 Tax=Consotaella aegiceratis TaxID=3097961 RepID=UPI002F3EFB0B
MRDVTRPVADELAAIGAGDGLLTVFIRHTSASLTIQENADPDVRADLVDALDRLAPEDAPYRHTIEGPDDMPAHIKTVLTGVNLSIPVIGGRMALGTWQGIYVVEHRARSHERELVLHFLGERRG